MSQESLTTVASPRSPFGRLRRWGATLAVLWSAPHRWENLATRFGVAAVLTMSAIQTAYFFGLASPDPVEKAKALVFSGWMDFCLFMAFLRAQRACAQEEVGKAVAWFVGCLPLASFTLLCNFMFSSHWQPPDPLALQRVGLSPLVALWIYACVPLVAVVYGTLFTLKERSHEEKRAQQQAKLEAQWQLEIATPRGRLRKMHQMRHLLAEQVGLDLEEADEGEQALFAAYLDLLAERGISLVDREAPIHFEALLQEMRRLGIQPRAANAAALFRARTTQLLTPATADMPAPQPKKQIPASTKEEHLSLVSPAATTSKRSYAPHLPTADQGHEQGIAAPVPPRSSAAAALQSMLAGDSDAWTTYLSVEEFISETGYNAEYIKRLVRKGDIHSEAVDGERRIPLAELARFALDRVSEELAARVLARREAEMSGGRKVVEASRGELVAVARVGEDVADE